MTVGLLPPFLAGVYCSLLWFVDSGCLRALNLRETIDYRCEDRKIVGELRGDIGAIR
jgi:hypothetical protein